MAEGLLNHYGKGQYRAYSAGTIKTEVHPLAIKAMNEIGINISNHISKDLDYFSNEQFDIAITVCDNAAEACPLVTNAKETVHWSFQDPSQATGKMEEQLKAFQSVRDKIADKINAYFQLAK